MNDELLDDEFVEEKPEEEQDIRILATSAVVVGFSSYVLTFILILLPLLSGAAKSELSSFEHNFYTIFHLIIAMIYFNYHFAKGDKAYNIKGGYYIIIIGSALYILFALLYILLVALFSSKLEEILLGIGDEVIYGILVITIKCFLVKPIAHLFLKFKKWIPVKNS